MHENYLPEFCIKPVLILGCGNILFGDDGFGPAVVAYLLEYYKIPEHVCLIDAGTGARKYLFTLSLSDVCPKEIIIIDAVDKGKPAGEIFEITIDDIPFEKTDDFSMHQAPTSNLLKEMREKNGVIVRVFACQAASIPAEISTGLSEPLQKAVPQMSSMIRAEFFQP
jgi:coenzyme F420 hydrogenase subunit delta